MLTPAVEFEYSPRVRDLFADLKHTGVLSVVEATHASPSGVDVDSEGDAGVASTSAPTNVVSALAGSREQGACVQLFIAVRDGHVQTARYKAYGCPHFLAACESVARWLKGRARSELSQWNWCEVETELDVPAAKRSRLLVLGNVLSQASKAWVG